MKGLREFKAHLAIYLTVLLILALSTQRSVFAAGPVVGLSLLWPVSPDNRTYLGQDYAQFNLLGNLKYHTGLDISSPEGTPVLAAAGGSIRRLDMIPGRFNGDNHCMGNVVIIDHSGIFTLYAHLQSIVVEDGVSVSQGTQIGTVGKTGAGRVPGCPASMNPHLHFEVKDHGVLGDISDDGPNWGYTPNHPDQHDYHDSILNLHSINSFVPPRQVRVENGVNLRVGPGGAGSNSYRVIKQVNAGEEYNALASSEPTVTPRCTQGWYQIRRIDGGRFVDTYWGGEVPDGWVCADLVSGGGDSLAMEVDACGYWSGANLNGTGNLYGSSFIPNQNNITAIAVKLYVFGLSAGINCGPVSLKLCSDLNCNDVIAKGYIDSNLLPAVETYPNTNAAYRDWVKIIFNKPVVVDTNRTYYFYYNTESCRWHNICLDLGNPYTDGRLIGMYQDPPNRDTSFRVYYQSNSGLPLISLTLTGCTTCRAGDRFTVQAHVINPGSRDVPVEAKVGVRMPDGTTVNVLGNKHLEVPLPAGLDTTFTLFDVPSFPAGLPTGTWTFEGTLLGPDLGETFSREVKPFEVVP